MEILIYAIVAILVVAIAVSVVSFMRAREKQRRLRRDKLDGVGSMRLVSNVGANVGPRCHDAVDGCAGPAD